MTREPNWIQLDRDYEKKCRDEWERRENEGLAPCRKCGDLSYRLNDDNDCPDCKEKDKHE